MFTVAKILDKVALLREAGERGEIKVIGRDEANKTTRYLVILDSLAVPIDVPDELWVALGSYLNGR